MSKAKKRLLYFAYSILTLVHAWVNFGGIAFSDSLADSGRLFMHIENAEEQMFKGFRMAVATTALLAAVSLLFSIKKLASQKVLAVMNISATIPVFILSCALFPGIFFHDGLPAQNMLFYFYLNLLLAFFSWVWFMLAKR